MSNAVSYAIFRRLSGKEVFPSGKLKDAQTGLAAALGTYKSSPTVIQARMVDLMRTAAPNAVLSDTMFPAITFRETTNDLDERFRDNPRSTQIYSMEFWTRSQSGTDLDKIRRYVDILLNHQQLPIVDNSVDFIYDCWRMATNSGLYDDTIKAFYMLAPYCIIVGEQN
jgi:hypothetical protein